MEGHYKNRCGEGKVTSNGFLTNLVTSKGRRLVVARQSSCDSIPFSPNMKKAGWREIFFNISLDIDLSPARRVGCAKAVDHLP
jgi:hypothetical protein